MPLRRLLFCYLLAIASVPTARAGFVVSSLQLEDGVLTDDDIQSNRIDTISNPLNQDSIAQVGMNIVESTYAFQWDESLGTGDFNTSMTHAIRSLDVRTVTRVQIFLEPDEDLSVTMHGSLTYAHTPNRDFGVLYGMSIYDFDMSTDVFQETHRGGNSYVEPSSGTFTIDDEAILHAGRLYRLHAVLDNLNNGEPNVGNLDASGYANFHIEPLVPEPACGLMLLLGVPWVGRSRKCRRA